MKTKSDIKKVRLNLDISERVLARLTTLQRRTDASSYIEVIRRALALYDYATGKNASLLIDGKVISLDILRDPADL